MNPALSINSNRPGRKSGVNAIFVAGTDTGVGKTTVTGLLGRYLLDRGYSVVTQKWAQTGNSGRLSDIDIHLKFMGKKRFDFKDHLSSMMPYVFRFGASPHLAARLERERIGIDKIEKGLKALSCSFDFVIVEGVGGLLVPLNNRDLLIDAVKELRLPVLLVAENRVGAINHALLSLEALKSRKIKIIGVVFNNISKNGTNPVILNDNSNIVKRFSRVKLSGALSYAENIKALRKAFSPIGNRIFKGL